MSSSELQQRCNSPSCISFFCGISLVDGRDALGTHPVTRLRRAHRGGARYSVARLIEKYGRKGNMMKWREMLNADCPRRDATGLHNRCALVCPDRRRYSENGHHCGREGAMVGDLSGFVGYCAGDASGFPFSTT